ncbi:unnamed protein product [Heligmosomoides polygyrus]|uniref:CC domain-containing protein n=1 Tax=Heligmosomoides polygyrus TaxID=6339 RepID=A0A3P8DD18_HELPZ|nr:unnamed protein product [Heligmosomoides polygyrus]
MLRYMLLLVAVFGVSSAKDISRSKRQVRTYYMCGGSSNGYVSTGGCGSSLFNGGCGSNCGGGGVLLPNSFYSPSSNCQTSCNNVNCNQYGGQQYIASYMGSGQYSPCASSCCGGMNAANSWPMMGSSMVVSGYNPDYYNPYAGNNGGYYNPYTANVNNVIDSLFGTGVSSLNTNPLTQVGPGPVIINNMRRTPVTAAFTGTVSNGVLLCGGNEPAGGSCAGNGQCPSGHLCMAGNVCCRCAVGASSGTCPSGSNSECPVGYGCSTTLSCCPAQVTPGQTLAACVNGACDDGFQCGKANLCYPSG